MKTILSIFRQAPAPEQRLPCALSIGNFDGVHRGHQAMIAQVCSAAQRLGLSPTILTFAPHPRQYFAQLNHRPELSPPQITGLRDKLTALANSGIERVVLARFNRAMAEMSASDFVTNWLARELNVRWLLVGEDFRFGRQRMGDVNLLRELGGQCGIEVHTLKDVTDEHGHRISSSEVRAALAAGDVERAGDLLGRPYGMTGHVIHGKKLGRTLAMPTMNMRVTPRCAARSGIYVVRAHGLGLLPLPGVASLGVRPTVEDDGRILLETHLFDLNIDAYGKLVRVELLQHLRDEEKFPDLPTLTAAMHADAQHARAYFALHGL
ncbi:bifunctional riboflavin kinase/FAD synthetase [Zwartia sp.]|uniref:bifunctional riboflavin kinase/FAD synthetase n=1 Tax=Zwartia sp. TaxID=2978004 RepID=UPI002722CA7E|nr:bifunctional riboflavin kinase/FAD synthetase [Zwartia sp.]MDO9023282.1 bifunctional riboflavin kinase/FAD synthetase [Zwartia sp.]